MIVIHDQCILGGGLRHPNPQSKASPGGGYAPPDIPIGASAPELNVYDTMISCSGLVGVIDLSNGHPRPVRSIPPHCPLDVHVPRIDVVGLACVHAVKIELNRTTLNATPGFASTH